MTAPRLRWAYDAALAPVLAAFFIRHSDPTYISFGEMQEGRALSAQSWSPDLQDRLLTEFTEALGSTAVPPTRQVAIAEVDDAIVGFAMVAFHPEAPRPYAVLEDVIVDRDRRGAGIGRSLVTWVLDACAQMGCPRVFLESGHRNHAAHDFFARLGFHPVATVLVRDP